MVGTTDGVVRLLVEKDQTEEGSTLSLAQSAQSMWNSSPVAMMDDETYFYWIGIGIALGSNVFWLCLITALSLFNFCSFPPMFRKGALNSNKRSEFYLK